MSIESLDWFIIFILLIFINFVVCLLIKRSKRFKDYFIASRKQKSQNLAISILAISLNK